MHFLLPPSFWVFIGGVIVFDVLQFGTWGAFMIFLSRLAEFLGRPYLEIEVSSAVRLGLVWWFCHFLLPIMIVLMPHVFILFCFVIAIVVVIVAATFTVQYIRLLTDFQHELY
jgi:hypothetical protein